MSDTPRTDAEALLTYGVVAVSVEFARKLERELNELRNIKSGVWCAGCYYKFIAPPQASGEVQHTPKCWNEIACQMDRCRALGCAVLRKRV